MDDATADSYRRMAANWSEDEYVQAYVSQILGEQRREPVYWQDIRFNRRTQPVVGVNWYEAMAYAAWLARVTGKGYCLPSEAQWEWAARRSVRRYPWDDKWDGSKCNWRSSGLNAPNPGSALPHGVDLPPSSSTIERTGTGAHSVGLRPRVAQASSSSRPAPGRSVAVPAPPCLLVKTGRPPHKDPTRLNSPATALPPPSQNPFGTDPVECGGDGGGVCEGDKDRTVCQKSWSFEPAVDPLRQA